MKLPHTTFWNAKQYKRFSTLIYNYLNEDERTNNFYENFPNYSNLELGATKKIQEYKHRKVVAGVLERQLSNLNLSEKQKENLEKLKLHNSVTITTGHQLNLLTGPLFFFHKILQVLKCCEEISKKYPNLHFIPIFWMATEDHDFEEINHFFYKNNKITWNRESGNAVGRMTLEGLNDVFDSFFKLLPDSSNAHSLKTLIKTSYLNSNNLAEATKSIVNQLFGNKGLLMIDGDDKDLKKLMIPTFEEDLLQNTAFHKVSETNLKLEKENYTVQVNPRKINLFYFTQQNKRERIVRENNLFKVLNSDIQFTQKELQKALHETPENFSPNVILRPLFQETILPNIAYIGGGGEIAYWLQLKSFFESQNVAFPALIVRNSILLLSDKQHKKLEKLDILYEDLFLPLHKLVRKNIKQNSTVSIDFNDYETRLTQLFDELKQKAEQTDVSFINMVNAQRTKQTKGLEKMKNRFVKAEKKVQSERVHRVETLYSEIFPHGNLQERLTNFSELWIEYGSSFIDEIYTEIKPIDFHFGIKTLR